MVILCRKCHVKVHQGEIVINGYADTSMGPILEYILLDYTINASKKMGSQMKQIEILEKNCNNNKINKLGRDNVEHKN